MALTSFQLLLVSGFSLAEALHLLRYKTVYTTGSLLDLDHLRASRLCFGRWLVQCGRLDELDADRDARGGS